jgi:hypothetical protein
MPLRRLDCSVSLDLAEAGDEWLLRVRVFSRPAEYLVPSAQMAKSTDELWRYLLKLPSSIDRKPKTLRFVACARRCCCIILRASK